jgi:uncharacterized membrane protein YfcA
MSIGRVLVLLLAGVGGGLSGSIAGLASLVTYPVLLALGLPPVVANVTNTVALVGSSAGSVLGSRPDLVGQGPRVRRLAVAGVAGGVTGGAVLLVTSPDAFESTVPWLIAAASVMILVRRRVLEVGTEAPGPHHAGPSLFLGVALVGIYGGYFGAGAGVMLLALLLFATREPVPRCNAVKNVVLGLANGIAAVVFVVFGDVRWSIVPPLAVGLFVGGRLGPAVVRRAPPTPLRVGIALAQR